MEFFMKNTKKHLSLSVAMIITLCSPIYVSAMENQPIGHPDLSGEVSLLEFDINYEVSAEDSQKLKIKIRELQNSINMLQSILLNNEDKNLVIYHHLKEADIADIQQKINTKKQAIKLANKMFLGKIPVNIEALATKGNI
jgi:hypothetical protein